MELAVENKQMRYIYNSCNSSGLITKVQVFIENPRIGEILARKKRKKRKNAFVFNLNLFFCRQKKKKPISSDSLWISPSHRKIKMINYTIY